MQAILFDLDGTLCELKGDFKKIFMAGCAQIFDDHPEVMYETVYPFWRKAIKQEGPSNAIDLLEKAFHEAGVEDEYDYVTVAQLLIEKYAAHVKLNKGAEKVLQDFASTYKLGLITNGPFDMQQAVIERLGIKKYFDVLIISGDFEVGIRKPDKKIFQIALDRLGVDSSDATMIGDSYEKDLVGAEDLGINTILVSTDDARGLTTTVTSLSDVPSFVKK